MIMVSDVTPRATIMSLMLRDAPLFSELPRESFACLCLLKRGTIAGADPGEILTMAGDQPSFLAILEGHVSVEPDKVMSPLYAYFGADDIIRERPCTTTVRAIDRVTYYLVGASDFITTMRECHGLAGKLLVGAQLS